MTDMTRETAEALLPFLANGTLQADERAQVEAWVSQDAELARDLDALRAIRSQMQESAFGVSPGAFGLARLIRDINQEKLTPSSPATGWKIAAAIAIALFAGQSLWTSGTIGQGQDFGLAGAEQAAVKAQLQVTFVQDASEIDIREILLAHDLQIVGGPSALGVYALRYDGAESVSDVVAHLADRALIIATVIEEQK